MVERIIGLSVLLLLLTACTPSTPSLPIPSSNITSNTTQNISQPVNITSELSSEKSPLDQRLLARGGGIFDFATLTAQNCDASIIHYRELLDEAEDDLEDLADELTEEERDLQKAQTALQSALATGDDRAVDRARRNIDDEQEDVNYVEDLVDEQTEYLRKLKLVFSTMREECPKLKARA